MRFWIAVGLLIAVATIGFGAWWVLGLDRGAPMDDRAGEDMAEMESTDVRLHAVTGWYEGAEIFFVHPEASDADVAAMLTNMMGGSPVLVVPELADVPPHALGDVYVRGLLERSCGEQALERGLADAHR